MFNRVRTLRTSKVEWITLIQIIDQDQVFKEIKKLDENKVKQKMWPYNLRVASCELRVASCNFMKINLRVASSFLWMEK